MATGPRYAVKFRRKRESRTNYKKRLAMLKCGLPRLVVRRTNTCLICHVVEYSEKGDKTLVHADSGMLRKYGWTYGLKNMPAAHLLGVFVGELAKKLKIKGAVFDIGLQHKKSSRLFAVLKGTLDSGLDVKHDELALPNEERIQGKHLGDKLAKDVVIVKDNIIKGKKVGEVKKKTLAEKKSKPKKAAKKKLESNKKVVK